MEYIAVLNNYLEYYFYDNHTVNLSFQSTSTHFFHATVSMKCCVTFLILLAETQTKFFSCIIFPPCSYFCKIRTFWAK